MMETTHHQIADGKRLSNKATTDVSTGLLRLMEKVKQCLSGAIPKQSQYLLFLTDCRVGGNQRTLFCPKDGELSRTDKFLWRFRGQHD